MKKEIKTVDGPYQIVFRPIQSAFVYLVDFGQIKDGQFCPLSSIRDFFEEIGALSLPCYDAFRDDPLFASTVFIEHSEFSDVLLDLARCRSFSGYAFYSNLFVISFNPFSDESKEENKEQGRCEGCDAAPAR